MPATVFDDLPAVKTEFDDLPDAPRGAFDDIPDVSPVERSSRIDAGLDFFSRTRPQALQDSLSPVATPPTPAAPQIEPGSITELPARPTGLDYLFGEPPKVRTGAEPIEARRGIDYPSLERPEAATLTPLEALAKPTKMPFPRVTPEQVEQMPIGPPGVGVPHWLAGPIAGTEQAVADVADFMTSGAGALTAMTGGIAGLPEAAAHAVASQIPKATAYAFAAQMAQSLPDQFEQVARAIDQGDTAAATRGLLNGAISLGVIGHAAKTAITPGGPALNAPENIPTLSTPTPPPESVPQPAPQATAPPVDVTGDLINELQSRVARNQIVKGENVPHGTPEVPPVPTQTPFDTLPEAKPETPPSTPGELIEKAVQEHPLTLPTEEPPKPEPVTEPVTEPVKRTPTEVGNYTVLDAVKEHGGLGGPNLEDAMREMEDGKTASQVLKPYGADYDSLSDALETIFEARKKGEGRAEARQLAKAYKQAGFGGDRGGADQTYQALVDAQAQGLGFPGGLPRDAGDLITRAWETASGKAAPAPEAQAEAFWKAVDDPNSKIGLQKVNVQDLHVGDIFRIRGKGISHEELTVSHLDPDTGEVQVKDGPKLGAQTLPDGAEIWVQKGTHTDAAGNLREEPPLFGAPESVEEQKARLAREAEQKRKAQQREELLNRQQKPLVGTQGDIGQGDLMGGGDLFSQSTEPTEEAQPTESRGGRGGNLSTFGLFDPANYRPAFEELSYRGKMLFRWGEQQREKIVARYRRGDTRDFISRTKDGSDNVAKLMGQRGANIVLHELNRSFGVKPEDVGSERNPLREMALTMRIESGGDRAALQEMRYRLTGEQAAGANLVWKRKALKAIDFAEQNWDRLEPAAREYQRLTDAENAFENANGIKTLYRKGGYVFHAQDVDESFGMPSTGQAQEAAGAPAPFRHIRDYQTYAEAIAAGKSPISLNAIDLLQKRLELGQRLIRYGDWADEFQNVTDPHTHLPIAQPVEVRTRADGTEDMTAPPGYQLVNFAGRDFALHNGYSGLFGDLTKPSWMQGTEFRQGVMKKFSTLKHGTLLLDTYHMVRLAFWNSMTRLGLPGYMKGVTILDNTTPELRKMIENGEIPKEWGDALVERKQTLERMIRQGLNVGSVGDNLYTDFLQNLPVLGSFNKWLFGKYQRGAMAEVALIEHDRQQKMFPDLSEDQLAARVARDVNTRFGNLQSQSWIKSRTGQDLARIIFLAPQWNESLIRAELGAVRQLAAAPVQSIRGGRLAMGALARSVGTAMLGIFVGNQLINMATRGHPTWDNPEEGFGAKISAYIPDAFGGPGFFLNPMSVPMEITNLMARSAERHGGDFTLALRDFAAGRFSGVSKALWTFFTGYTPMGQPTKGGWYRVAQSIGQAVPTPISAGPIARGVAQAFTGENREKYPGEIQKQAMQSVGVKTEPVPDAQRRMYDLAANFKRSKGITEPPTREMSFYGDLTSAVKTGNMQAANEALDKILTLAKGNGDPHTLQDVEKYYQQFPQRTFTNNRQMEGAFKRRLSPEQLRTYDQAVKDRQAIAATVQRLIAERWR